MKNFLVATFLSVLKNNRTILLPLVLKHLAPAIFLLFLVTLSSVVSAQSPVPGMRANGRIVSSGDTIKVCVGSSILYENTSQGYSTIKWRFNNGNPATSTTNTQVSIAYNTAGIDSTIQTVIYNNTDTATMFILVQVNNQKPTAAYTFTPNNECGNVPVVFTNSSIGNPDPLTYNWSFGDGGVSTNANPTYQFLNAIGASGTVTYPVKLKVTNSLACSDSITQQVTVKKVPDALLSNPDPNVIFTPFNGTPTFRRCENTPFYSFKFLNATTTSAINTNYTIKWGDASPDSSFATWPAAVIISHPYSIGQHEITVTVTGSNGCIGIKKYNVFLGTTPAGGFASLGNTSICAPNSLKFVVTGYQTNTTGTTYKFTVNDGTPTEIYGSPPPDTVSHVFSVGSCGNSSSNGAQTFTNAYRATLDVENPCGSTSVSVIPIYVSGRPRAAMSVSPSLNVCTNYPVFINNITPYGGTIIPSGGGASTCTNSGRQVWTITPSTGYTVGNTLGSINGSYTNGLLWTSGSNFLNINFNTAGTYTIKLYVANELCGIDSTTKTICVRNPPQASFTMSKKTSCGIDTVILNNTSPTGGCLGDSYNWSVVYSDPSQCNTHAAPNFSFVNGTTATTKSPNLQFINPGRYIVTLTVSSIGTSVTCPPASFIDTFYVRAKPKAKINTLSAVCIGNNLSPTATVINCYGTDPLSYLWTFNNGTPATSNLPIPGQVAYNTIGTFPIILDVTNECGVTSDTVKAIITSTPVANAGVDTSICSGIPIKIGTAAVAGITYSWTPTTGLSSATVSNPTATLTYNGPNTDTTFTYIVTASAGANCFGRDTISITIKKKPVVSITPAVTSVCTGASAQLAATGASIYTWSPAATLNSSTSDTVIASPANTTTYIVNGTAANGCSNSASATVTVIPFVAVNAGKDTTVCNISTATQLTGTPSGGVWGGSAFVTSTGVFNANAAGNGTYNLTYTAGNGNCTRTDTVIVTVIDPPNANAGIDSTVCQSTVPLQLQGLPVGGKWSGNTFVTTAGLFTPSVPGIYSLIYTIGGGSCIGRDTVVITVAGGVTNNLIASSQTICTGTQPAALIGQIAAGGNGNISYQWQSSTDNINWTDIALATSKDYAPGVLTDTTWFRRVAFTILCSGPQSSISQPVKITVNPNATAFFNPGTLAGCAPYKITTAIINLTTYTTVTEYRWYANGIYIGSGNSFPGYTINNSGDSVTIRLVAVSKFGCKNDTMERQFFTVEKALPSYTQSDSVGCGPLKITFTNTTPNASKYTYFWNFGQGQTSTLLQPAAITFPINPNYGDTVYTVTMKVFSACDTITITKFVRVRAQPKVLFTPDKTEGCSPMTVTFSNTSRGSNANYSWSFGDGSSTVATNNTTIQHLFNTGVKDTFYVKLRGQNDCGADSSTYAIVVNPNSIRIDFAVNGNERFGCTPHTVHFINNSKGANSFIWNFGDGLSITTTKGIDTVVHTYTTAGNYNVSLNASNSCNDTTDFEPITVYPKPAVSFSASPTVACVNDSIRFINNSDAAVTNAWRFADGTTSFARNPVHVYNAPGTYKVALTGSIISQQGLGCSDSAFANIIIRDTLPGAFVATDTVGSCTPFTVTFKNVNPSGRTTWRFGDGAVATGDTITHTYTSSGNYLVTMVTGGNGGCIYKATKNIIVTSPAGFLSYNGGSVCIGNALRLQITATNTPQYRFVFGDGDSLTTTSSTLSHLYTKPGTFVPYAYLLAANCSIKIQTGDTVKVDKVVSGFTRTLQQSCGSTTIQYNDTSYAYFGVQSWQWNFGDGTISSQRNPVKVYTQAGTYNTQLTVISTSGCKDTASIPATILIRNYPSASIGGDTLACTGQPLNLSAFVLSQDSLSNYNWSFGNGFFGSGKNVKATYNTSGIYTIRLVTTTIYGCADTVYKLVRVNASPVINAGADVQICRGKSVQLNAFGAPTLVWTPIQDLSCSTCANPVASPLLTTQYVVKGTNNANCSVTDTIVVQVIQPIKLTVSASDSICVGDQTQIFAGGATLYLWNPTAGLSSGTVPNPIAKPTVTTQYRVVGYDAFNCFADTGYITVAVGNYPTVDIGTGATVVAGTQVTFNPVLTNGPFKNYVWTPITDLSCSNCLSPVATINKDITYKLEVENLYGCKASDTITYKAVCQEAQQVFIPNAFSPDGDGVNDVLMVRGRGFAMVKYFRVFNRWGQLVFERSNFSANDAQFGWDGKVNGVAANPDVYVYTAEIICSAGENFVRKGNVTLVR